MLQKISDLPPGTIGIEARGRVTKADYETVLAPLLDEAYAGGKRIRFLYKCAADFSEFTPSAAWEDFQLGLRYLRLFEKCAVVSDVDWIRKSCQVVGSFMPCPVRAYNNGEMAGAVEWLSAASRESNVDLRLLTEKSVLVVEPKGPLRSEDFDRLSAAIDPWIEQQQGLNGLVIHVSKFPGWEGVGSFFRHIQFVRGHHRDIKRIAVVSSGVLEFIPRIAAHFVKAEVKTFRFEELDTAIDWAAARK